MSFFVMVLSSQKPVSIRDKATGQLVTSSLLTWENFNSNGNAKEQFEYAIAGGHYTGADVSIYHYACALKNEFIMTTYTHKYLHDSFSSYRSIQHTSVVQLLMQS